VFILAPLDPGGNRYSRGDKVSRPEGMSGPKGRVLRPEGPKIETRMPESGGGVLEEGQPAPSPPARGSEEAL